MPKQDQSTRRCSGNYAVENTSDAAEPGWNIPAQHQGPLFSPLKPLQAEGQAAASPVKANPWAVEFPGSDASPPKPSQAQRPAAPLKQRALKPAAPLASSATSLASILCLGVTALIVAAPFLLDTNPWQTLPHSAGISKHMPLFPMQPYAMDLTAPPLHSQLWYLQHRAPTDTISEAAEAAPSLEDASLHGSDTAAACHSDGLASFSEIWDTLDDIWTSEGPSPECLTGAADEPANGSGGSRDDTTEEIPMEHGTEGMQEMSPVEKGISSSAWACVDGGMSWRSRARLTASLLGRVAAREAACGAHHLIHILQDLLQLLHSAAVDMYQRSIGVVKKLQALAVRFRNEDTAQVAKQVVSDLRAAMAGKVWGLYDLAAPLYAQGMRQIHAAWAVAVQMPRQVLDQVKTGLGWLPEDQQDESSDDNASEAQEFDYDDSWLPEPASGGSQPDITESWPEASELAFSPGSAQDIFQDIGMQQQQLDQSVQQDSNLQGQQTASSSASPAGDVYGHDSGLSHEAAQHPAMDVGSWPAEGLPQSAHMEMHTLHVPEPHITPTTAPEAEPSWSNAPEGAGHFPQDDGLLTSPEMSAGQYHDSLSVPTERSDLQSDRLSAQASLHQAFPMAAEPSQHDAEGILPVELSLQHDSDTQSTSQHNAAMDAPPESPDESLGDLAWLAAHEASLTQALTNRQRHGSDPQLSGAEEPADSAQQGAGSALQASPISPPPTAIPIQGHSEGPVMKPPPAATILSDAAAGGLEPEHPQPECTLAGGSKESRLGQGHAGVNLLAQVAKAGLRALEPAANYVEDLVGMHASSLMWILGTIIIAGISMALMSHLMHASPAVQARQPVQASLLPRNEAGGASAAARSAISMSAPSASAHASHGIAAQQAASTAHPYDQARPDSAQPSGSVQPSTLSGAVTVKPIDAAPQGSGMLQINNEGDEVSSREVAEPSHSRPPRAPGHTTSMAGVSHTSHPPGSVLRRSSRLASKSQAGGSATSQPGSPSHMSEGSVRKVYRTLELPEHDA
ncbi:hypothetical protein WJX74_006053 [Apatococcus lobatus]|uniref:Uncharacterized protein n=1 Tax=Apatococcus lobatus TaxID=904363 RepID=A0AAW1Q9D8_9CHLO